MNLKFLDSKVLILSLIAATLIGQGSGYGKLYFFHILLSLNLIAFLWTWKFDSSHLKEIKELILLGVFSIISLAWSSNIKVGILENIHFWMGVLVLFLALNARISLGNVYRIIRTVLWLNLAICLGESLNLFRYPYSIFSELAVNFGKAQGDWVPQSSDVPTGFHWNPNNNAFFCLIFSPIFLSKAKKLESYFYVIITTWVIFMSSSKLIIIGWIFLLMMFVFLNISKRTIIAFLACIALVATSAVLFSDKNAERLEKYSKTLPSISKFLGIVPGIFVSKYTNEVVTFDYTKTDLSLHERLVYIDGLAPILKNNLLLGVGAGGLSDKTNEQANVKMSLATPHFYLLELVTKYGVLFFALYLFWFLNLFRRSFIVNKLSSLSMLFFLAFSPVISTASYFLPMWIVFLYNILSIENSKSVR